MDQVKIAVEHLYNAETEQEVRRLASKWLEHFQNTLSAWNVSMAILNEGCTSGGGLLELFAAQTIKHKVEVDYVQLDERATIELRDQLWAMCFRPGIARTVRTQLELALAALVVQCNEGLWPKPVETICAQISNRELRPTLIELLAMIPEQLMNRKIHLPRGFYEQQVEQLVQREFDRVVQLLKQELFSSNDRDYQKGLLNCLLSWVRYGEGEAVKSLDLMRIGFEFLRQDYEDCETASEMICEIYFRLQKPTAEWFSELVGQLHKTSPVLLDVIRKEETDQVRFCGAVFLEAGEAFADEFTANQPACHMLMQNVLSLSEYSSDLSTVEATFSFWSVFASTQEYMDIYARLFRLLISHHLAFPETSLSVQELDQFRDFRHIVGDCLKDCCRVIGSTGALLTIQELLQACSIQSPWQIVEAILFALRTISSAVDRRESEALPQLIPMLLQLTYHPKLVYGVILNIGCYAEWVKYHPEYLDAFLDLVAQGFTHPSTQSASAQTFMYLCQSCNLRIQVVQSLYLQNISILHSRDQIQLTRGVAAIVCRSKDAVSHLGPLVDPWINSGLALEHIDALLEGIEEDNETAKQIVMFLWPHIIKHANTNPDLICQCLRKVIVICGQSLVSELFDLIQEIFKNNNGASALYICRSMVINLNSQIWPQVYQFLTMIMSHGDEIFEDEDCAKEYLSCCSAAINHLEPFVQTTQLVRHAVTVTEKVLHKSTQSLLNSALVFLQYLLSKGSGDHAVLCIQAILYGLVQHYPLQVLSDCASVLRRFHQQNPLQLQQLFHALLQSLPESYFTEREKQVWMEQFVQMIGQIRVREFKDLLLQFVQACRRRLNQL